MVMKMQLGDTCAQVSLCAYAGTCQCVFIAVHIPFWSNYLTKGKGSLTAHSEACGVQKRFNPSVLRSQHPFSGHERNHLKWESALAWRT